MNPRGKWQWPLLMVVGVAALAGSGCGSDDPQELAYRAQAAWSAGRPAEAADALRRLGRTRPLTIAERLLFSRIAALRGQFDEARGVLDDPHLPAKGPDAALLAARCGELEIERHRFRSAEADLIRALALNRDCVDARRRLIWLYAQQGRSSDLCTQARLLALSATLEFTDLVMWTLAWHEPIEAAELAEVLRRAIREDPGDRASRLALAECLRRLGRLDEADSTLGALEGTDPEVRAARVRVSLDRGDVARAEFLLGTVPKGEEHPALARLRGRLALARDDAGAAVRHFRAALEAAPDDRDTQFGLACALRLAGQPEAARPYGESASAQDRLEWLVQRARPANRRNDPETLRTIAAACLRVNRRELARGWYQLVLRLAAGDSEARRALSELDSALGSPPRSQQARKLDRNP